MYCENNPVMFVDPWGLIREPGYVDGVWHEDPDAYEYGKDSVKYQILVALGDAWMNTDSEEKRAKYHKAANAIREYDANVDASTLTTVYLLNNEIGANKNGHNGIMLANSGNEGVFFSFYPEGGSYPAASGQMRFNLLTSNEVEKFKKSGNVSNAIALGKYSATTQNETYTRYISVVITATQGSDMLKKGISYVVNPGTYLLVGNQCDNVASKIMRAGNKGYYVSNRPNWSFEGVSKDWGLSIINIGE